MLCKYFIAHLVLENGLEHFVVVKKIVNNTIYVMDPAGNSGAGFYSAKISTSSKHGE